MSTLTYAGIKYQFEQHGSSFVCIEAENKKRYWWDLLQLDDNAEPAFTKQYPHNDLPKAVSQAADAFILGLKGKQQHERLARSSMFA